MSERKWTEKQLQAIETRDRTLLVSAAAGSGKTATLTERIIRSLMDEENPVSVDSLLVVTFTNAAASELRVKIQKALEDAVRANPENRTLERQLFMLPQAKIRTIDSFCGDILRSGADRVGVPFNYRIADAAECELISSSILGGLIETVYSGLLPEIATPEELESLSDCLTDSKRTEELVDIFRLVYEKCESSVRGVDLVGDLCEIYKTDLYSKASKMPHLSYILSRLDELLSHYLALAKSLCERFAYGDDDSKKYYALALRDIDVLSVLRSKKDYTELRAAISDFKLDRRQPIKGEKTPDMELYESMRESLKEDIKKIRSLFNYTVEEWYTLYDGLYDKISVLYRFLREFDSAFVSEKLRRGLLSYADVERFAYKCLVADDGTLTDIAENLKNSFSAIYIDEYQDVNALQNSIFEAISRPDNRFMVGDIKQSIYGFRSACPEIFAEMKNSFAPIEKAENKAPASVFMSNNFRCDRGIVDFVNSVFDKMFGLLGESIGYLEEDRLVYSKVSDSVPEYRTPEICMMEKQVSGNSHHTDDEEEENSSAPTVVAKKIKELLNSGRLDNGNTPSPSDIAIILRNAKGKDRLYAEALEKEGIPVKISGAKSFFLSAEILLVLCLLNSIDNPGRDVYLAGLMCSPLYSFTPDEMYLIRRGEGREGSLYDALIRYNKAHPEFQKGLDFVKSLNRYRTLSEGVRCDELLFRLYHETGLLALASNSGGKENLMLLYDYAREFEAGEFLGLYNFIHFINSLIDKRTTFDEPREKADGEAVKIVTCHASKGLEYPIVFLVNTGDKLTNKDSKNRLAYSSDMGIAVRLRTPSGLSAVNNPVFDVINHYNFRRSFEEELRVLYVAMTRAREQLYIVGVSPLADREKYLSRVEYLKNTLSPYSARSLSSYLEIILTASGVKALSAEEFIADNVISYISESKDAVSPATVTDAPCDEGLMDKLYERFTYRYPREALCRLPEKMSVSKTYPQVLDIADEGVVLPIDEKRDSGRIKLPTFMSGSKADESAKRGIATHYVLQFCDLNRFAEGGAEAELERLVKEGFISAADGKRVRISELEGFRKSKLFSDMLEAKSLYRELRFNVRLPSAYFTADEEKRKIYKDRGILVQGVIDCIIERDDGTIALYDYKTDRLSPDELSDREKGRKTLADRHRTQLSYYALAAERIFGRVPSEIGIYSLHLGEVILVEPDKILQTSP